MKQSVSIPLKSLREDKKSTFTVDTVNGICGCADCRKTYRAAKDNDTWRSNRYKMDTPCPDCGGKQLSSSLLSDLPIDTTTKTRAKKKMAIKKDIKQDVYRSDDDKLQRVTTVSTYDVFTIYPSNRMHSQTVECTFTADMDAGTMQCSYMDVTDKEHPVPIGMYDLDSEYANGYNQFNNLEVMNANSIRKYQTKGGYERSIVPFVNSLKFTSDSFGNNDVSKNLATTIANEFDIEVDQGNESRRMAMVDFMVRYPGLRDMVLEHVNENLSYKKDLTDREKRLERTNEVNKYVKQMSNVDQKLLADLRQCKTGDEAYSYLSRVTFGKEADGSKIKDSFISRVNIDEASFEGYGIHKKIRKNFNQNPLGTANFVYTTIGKIGFRDVNHLYQMLDLMESQKAADDDWYHSKKAFNGDTITPIEKKAQLRFIKTYAKSHTPGQTIKDWYENKGNYEMFSDCADMYNKMCEVGYVCATQAECDIASVEDAKRKIKGLMDEGMDKDAIVEAVEPYWALNGDTSVATTLVEKTIEDIKVNGVEEKVAFYGRDGKPLISNRTPQEIHEELSRKNRTIQELSGGPKRAGYTKEIRDRFNLDIGDYKFRIPKNTYEVIRTGEQMQICVGGSGYCNSVQRGDPHCIIVTMADKAGQKVGCIEISNDNIKQFKSPRNHAICDERCGKGAVDAAKEFIEKAKLNDSCEDVRHFCDEGYAPYGDGDFTQAHLPSNPYPSPRVMMAYFKGDLGKNNRKLPEVPVAQAQAESQQSLE